MSNYFFNESYIYDLNGIIKNNPISISNNLFVDFNELYTEKQYGIIKQLSNKIQNNVQSLNLLVTKNPNITFQKVTLNVLEYIQKNNIKVKSIQNSHIVSIEDFIIILEKINQELSDYVTNYQNMIMDKT